MLGILHKGARRVILLAVIATLLVGCKADELELQIDLTQLRSAAAGNEVLLPLKAVFTDPRPLNTRQSAQVDDVWSTLSEYMRVREFKRENVDGGLRVTIESEVPVLTTRNADDALFVSFTESTIFSGLHRVTLESGERFEALQDELASINFALDLAEFHPTTIEITGRSSRLVAPAATVEDESHLLYDGTLDGQLRIRQSGGAFEQTGPGFFVRMDR
ncbi:hypothetical protein [Spiribacter vilamensis]|uniref:Uncharacterized protein n=1 Tax=Spiribacter vilamensis TaxID=531306 RepID=A0A4Q8D0L4_9GAMM|nr:hypothetical protein [Spiribacter vilamensis]RZU98760.1 hypothetical protein EV698_1021 [Spiribacter vilamensis]TVO62218.1 hypothetical protein FPL09_09110 [Spiribacter vilamensis]